MAANRARARITYWEWVPIPDTDPSYKPKSIWRYRMDKPVLQIGGAQGISTVTAALLPTRWLLES